MDHNSENAFIVPDLRFWRTGEVFDLETDDSDIVDWEASAIKKY